MGRADQQWVACWDHQGDEYWLRPLAEGDDVRLGRNAVVMSAEDAEYPFSYIVRVNQ